MFMNNVDIVDFEEALRHSKWRKEMKEEINAIKRNQTWELTYLLTRMKKVRVKWVIKIKLNEKGEIDKSKAWFVAKRYAQQFGIDYDEIYAPVTRWDTIHIIIALAVQRNWPIYQLDLKSAFLHGDLSETVYVEQPLGFVKVGEEEKVYKFKKTL